MTMLEQLEEETVFRVIKQGNTSVIFEEACDSYYSMELNKAQLTELIDELSVIRDDLIDVT